LQAKLGEAMKE